TEQGYGNFCGAVVYECEAPVSVKNAFLKPVGDYSQCVIFIGDEKYRCMMEEGVVVPRLSKGKIRIECYSTLRNRIGPFHYASPYDDCISKDCFTLRGNWKNERENKLYCKEKREVPFGLEKIRVLFD
ncbi:MAG: hypothetical protein IJ800_07680, partial [Clostridia bacterium]|nr:hypothetical protein [Clostridia bacterium]